MATIMPDRWITRLAKASSLAPHVFSDDLGVATDHKGNAIHPGRADGAAPAREGAELDIAQELRLEPPLEPGITV